MVLCENEVHPLIPYPFLKLAPVIKPLIEAQPYISSLKIGNHPADLDICAFRNHIDRTKTLLHAQTIEAERLLGGALSRDDSPWLTCGDHSYTPGRIIIARSHRYHNPYFPWKEFVKDHSDRILFIGNRDEHRSFEEMFGGVEFYKPKDLLEAAEMIKTANIFVGNQSSPHAVAMGLGVDIIQETSPWVPDCIFKRKNVQYVTDKGFIFEGERYGYEVVDPDEVNTMETPPGMWQYKGEKDLGVDGLVDFFYKKDKSVDKKTLRSMIISDNIQRVKGHFMNRNESFDFSPWKQALENAGI